jgi:hypothetical protein
LAAIQDRILGNTPSARHSVGTGIDVDDIDTARLPSPDLQLPYDSEGGNIVGMGRDPIKNQTPDLFSTARLDGSPSNNPPEAVPGGLRAERLFRRICQRPFGILRTLELDWLLRVATEETKRRGRAMPMTEASLADTPAVSSEPIPKQTKPPGRPTHQRAARTAAIPLTRGQDAPIVISS